MSADGGRTIIALSGEPRLAAAVREQVAREVALVRWCTPDHPERAWTIAHPWPWIVISPGLAGRELEEACLASGSVLVWLGHREQAPPGATVGFGTWPALARWLSSLGRRSCGQVRLAPYRGVLVPDGSRHSSPAVEGLLAAMPRGLPQSPRVRRAVGPLRRWGVPYHTRRDGQLLRLAIGSRVSARESEGENR